MDVLRRDLDEPKEGQNVPRDNRGDAVKACGKSHAMIYVQATEAPLHPRR